MTTKKLSVRIPEEDWTGMEEIAFSLSHEMGREVKVSELSRQAIKDFLYKWRTG